MHVPLLIKPGPAVASLPSARQVQALVSLVDLAPTLLDLAGVPATVGADGVAMDGMSWLPHLRGDAPAPATALFASQTQYQKRSYRWREANHVLLITFRGGAETREIFDLDSDPTELHDLAISAPGTLAAMNARMAASNAAQVRGRDPRPSENRSDRESLRGLGYVQ